jgi:hypothetical protein
MMRAKRALVGLVLVLALLAAARGSAASNPALTTHAQQVVTQFAGGNVTAVAARMTAAVQKQIPAAQLQAARTQATASLGTHKGQQKTVSGAVAGGAEVVVTATFTHGTMDVRVHFTAQSRIDGLYLQPHPSS